MVSGQQELPTPGARNGENLATPPAIKTDTKIRVHSDLVVVPVTVTDKSGRAVSGLEKEDFTLFEDDRQQEITHFAVEDAPVSIAIVFDASTSMTPNILKARQTVDVLLSSINPMSESALVKVATTAQLVVPLDGGLQTVRNAIERIDARGSTALLDGIHLGMAEMQRARYSRKAIIIISDGEDNASHWTVDELKAAVKAQDILIYSIFLSDTAGAYVGFPQRGLILLSEIANQTGGFAFVRFKAQQLPVVAHQIGDWLRNQYLLSYVPDRAATDGSYRKIRLKLAEPKGYPRMKAVWRRGYYAPKE